MLVMKKDVMCSKVQCRLIESRIRWQQSLEKKSNYDDGGGWEVKIDEIGSKHWQPPATLDRDINDFQTLINQTHD